MNAAPANTGIVVQGVVRNVDADQGVAGAVVRVQNGEGEAVVVCTDVDGRWRALVAPSGEYIVDLDPGSVGGLYSETWSRTAMALEDSVTVLFPLSATEPSGTVVAETGEEPLGAPIASETFQIADQDGFSADVTVEWFASRSLPVEELSTVCHDEAADYLAEQP